MSFFVYDLKIDFAVSISARDADREYKTTDAGIDDTFIISAPSHTRALSGARDWARVRGDDDEPNMPDGIHLEERIYDRVRLRSYMILSVE